MRIRTIKPEFWRSDDIAALSLEDRLLFIGLWSYVDDSGIGEDKLASICADLFAPDLEENAPEVFARVSGGLRTLSERGLIYRYVAEGRRYLYVSSWRQHQRIDKPTKSRYPAPDKGECPDSGSLPGGFAEDSRRIPEKVPAGTGEQGNRGTGEKESSSELRPDVEAMLDYLDGRIVACGVRTPPSRTKKNRDAARLMIDRDRYDQHEMRQVIDWATSNQFWATNIGCASKLREKYETLRGQMNQKARAAPMSKQERNLAILDAAEERWAQSELDNRNELLA